MPTRHPPAASSSTDHELLEGVLRASTRVSIIATDTQGVIQLFNPGAERMLGYAAHEVVGRLTPAAIHLPEEVEHYGRELSRRLGRSVAGFEVFVALARQGGSEAYDTRRWTYVRKDGGHVPVDLSVTAIRGGGSRDGGQGEIQGFLGVAVDLSEREKLQSRLARALISVDNAADMLFWCGVEDRRIDFVNKAALATLGYARAELIGQDVSLVNPERDVHAWATVVATLRRNGRCVMEALYRRKDGTLFPVEITASLALHKGREFAVGIVRDITERKRMQARADRQLRVSNALAELARALVEPAATQAGAARLLLDRARELTGSPHGLVAAIASPDGAMEFLCSTDMMPGHDHPQGRKLFAPLDKDSYPGLWGHSLTMRKGFYENNPAGHPSSRGVPPGHLPVHRILAVPVLVPAAGGLRPIGQIALANAPADYTAEDLAAVQSLADLYALGSEQLRIRAELERARDEAQAASRAKSDFLANMTHEVRTPLNGILGMLQLLETTSLDADQGDYLSVALQSAGKLSGQLDNVLEFARLDAAGGAECVPFPPTDLLNTLQAQYAPAARAKGLALETRAEPGLPELVNSDPQALRQALGHLLDNAIKFTEAGGVRLVALSDSASGQEMLTFRVEDSGIGIQEHMKRRIFAAFVQGDATTTRRYGGAGLGLAIAAKLAARLGGGIRVQDRPGGGVVMILTARLDCAPTPLG